ncbi:MAG: ribonuclease HIII [Planctomycetes bacterium]|nr:ribonuclease HIII [Planctomycetota bacterium]
MSALDKFCEGLLARAGTAGWSLRNQRSIPYGRQYELADTAGGVALLNCYEGKKGLSFVAAGKLAARLAADLGAAPVAASASAADPFKLGFPRIGADESGKGDYFGPLVVAAWRLREQDVATLQALGITDSKKLADGAIQRMAGKLDEIAQGHAIVLLPEAYNQRYSRTGNLNVLLAQLHGQCICALADKAGAVPVVVVDQFARDTRVLGAGMPAGARLVTRTGGEADLAVAAASVLARAAFVAALKDLGSEYGMALPPGAGSPVLKAGREFKRSFGEAELGKVAKLHFATTAQL